MKRVLLIVAYDGTNYCGWQVQPNQITVEGVINKTLSALLKTEITVIGASRTDSGVHALGNVAVFDTDTMIPAHKISYALNQRLPEDIRIHKSYEVPLEFHPRYCDCRKTYRYTISNNDFIIPTQRLYSYFVYKQLDVEAMKEGAKFLVGTHDFKSYCTVNPQVKDTVRTIYDIQIKKENDLITIELQGNGFLYNMIRIIAGTLVKVGLGQFKPERVKEALEALNRQAAGPTAPPEGLMLVKIDYGH